MRTGYTTVGVRLVEYDDTIIDESPRDLSQAALLQLWELSGEQGILYGIDLYMLTIFNSRQMLQVKREIEQFLGAIEEPVDQEVLGEVLTYCEKGQLRGLRRLQFLGG